MTNRAESEPDEEAQAADASGAADESSRVGPLRWILIGLGLVALILLGREGAGFIPEAVETVRDLGPWAAVGYVVVYVIATVAWVPGSILTLASGAVFGLVKGTLYTLIGATLGATAAFLVARYVARGAIERRLGRSRKLAAVDRALGREGAKLIFLIRLSPAIPFNALNYALGLTAVRLRDYVWTSFLGMAPGTFLYVYAGWAAGQVASTGEAEPRGTGYWIMLGVGLLATIAVTVFVTRIARRALRRATGGEVAEGENPSD